uniref:C-type lectin domain-containing protein n=1 Tax=Pinctada fucata TaxID=50426 RepID=A0A194AM00_PINFU
MVGMRTLFGAFVCIFNTFLTASVSGQGYTGCPTGWQAFREKCYFFSDFAVTYADAASLCRASNAKLAEPSEMEGDSYLRNQTMQKNVRFYIGVADYFVEGKWMFISSLKQATPTYWESGEPNNDGDEDCVEILPGSGQWADCSCTLQRNFICEKNVVENVNSIVIG